MEELREFKLKIEELSVSVNRLLNAVIGDEATGNLGLNSRLIKLESRIEELERRIDKLDATAARVIAYATAVSFLVASIWQASKLLFDIWTK